MYLYASFDTKAVL